MFFFALFAALRETSLSSYVILYLLARSGFRGFGVRREDMKKMLLATRGKVFTLQNLNKLVECTRLKEFKTK